jgi:beta-glucosidase
VTVDSDYFSVRQLSIYHQLADDPAEAATLALEAGIDVELPGRDCYGQPLLNAVRAGKVELDVINEAVRRVLQTKFELGLFENPFVDSEFVLSVSDIQAHRDLARTIAEKSMILLRNDNVLPIAANLESVAVIGPNADSPRNLFGDYTYPAHLEALAEMSHRENIFSIPFAGEVVADGSMKPTQSVLQALKERLEAKVSHARGCDVDGTSTEGFADAVNLAARCDLAILVMGDKAGLTDDCTSGEGRDRQSLALPGVQEDLVRAVVTTGTPAILVLVAGRPIGSPWVHENCAAVVMGWLPGEEGAAAIADVLTGTANPGGKLPISYPRGAGQIPIYYRHKPSGGRSQWKGDYVDGSARPLYPFGFGLSYTPFELSDPKVIPQVVSQNDVVTVTVRLTNSGTRDGDQVVQLYIRGRTAAVTRPVLELKGFARVEVPAGSWREVTFGLPVGQTGFYDRALGFVVEPGPIDVFVGSSSADVMEAGTFTVAPDPSGRPVDKLFEGTVQIAGPERKEP